MKAGMAVDLRLHVSWLMPVLQYLLVAGHGKGKGSMN